MSFKYLDRIIFPEVSMDGIEAFYDSMKESYQYSNFGPISLKLKEAVHQHLALDQKFNVMPVNNGHLGIIAFGYLLKMLNKTKHIVIADIGFASQWQFIEQFFDKATILPANDKYYLDAQTISKYVSQTDCDVVYVTAAYGQDISKELLNIRKLMPDVFIIADCANALFSSTIIHDEKIFYMSSLHATKLYGVGEGGLMIFDAQWEEYIKKIVNFGMNQHREIDSLGTNAKMSEFTAALGLINLPLVNEKLDKLQLIKKAYLKYAKDMPVEVCGETSIMLRFATDSAREKVQSNLTSKNIAVHHMYLLQVPEWVKASKKVKVLGESTDLRSHSLGLPFHTLLTEEHVAHVMSYF